MSQRLEAEDFEQQLGQAVIFFNEAINFEARVSQVDRLKQHSSEDRQPFSVVFSANHPEAYAQNIYTIKHAEKGEQMIFLVPIGPDETGMCYEAVFA
jgi:hypothetical protein